MFVDFLTLMLINMVSALVMYALFMAFFFEKNQKVFIAGFLLVGAVALVTGFRMIFTWPLPGAYNIMYGESTVLLGAIFFVTGLALQFGWDLRSIGIPAFFAGAGVALLGFRIWNLNLTSEPLVAGLGFLVAGLTAIGTGVALWLPKVKIFRWLTALASLGAAIIFCIVVFPAYWGHIDSFKGWAPDSMLARRPPAPAQ
jgi:putative membrane protein